MLLWRHIIIIIIIVLYFYPNLFIDMLMLQAACVWKETKSKTNKRTKKKHMKKERKTKNKIIDQWMLEATVEQWASFFFRHLSPHLNWMWGWLSVSLKDSHLSPHLSWMWGWLLGIILLRFILISYFPFTTLCSHEQL